MSQNANNLQRFVCIQLWSEANGTKNEWNWLNPTIIAQVLWCQSPVVRKNRSRTWRPDAMGCGRVMPAPWRCQHLTCCAKMAKTAAQFRRWNKVEFQIQFLETCLFVEALNWKSDIGLISREISMNWKSDIGLISREISMKEIWYRSNFKRDSYEGNLIWKPDIGHISIQFNPSRPYWSIFRRPSAWKWT